MKMKVIGYEVTDQTTAIACQFLATGRSWLSDYDMIETVRVCILPGCEKESASLARNKAEVMRYAAGLLLSLADEIDPV